METNIGKYVQIERKKQGITQEQLAELTGISWSSISRFETGQTMLSVEKILKIVKVLDIGIEKIFFDYIKVYPNTDDDVTKEIMEILSVCTDNQKRYALESIKLILKYVHEMS